MTEADGRAAAPAPGAPGASGAPRDGEHLHVPAGLMVGAGLGAWLDLLLPFDLLQWLSMPRVSSLPPPTTAAAMHLHTLAQGLLFAVTATLTLFGLALLVRGSPRRAPRPTPALLGSLLVGWGLFNLAEALFDQALRGPGAYVAPLGPPLWEPGGFVSAAALILGGLVVLVHGRREARDGGGVIEVHRRVYTVGEDGAPGAAA